MTILGVPKHMVTETSATKESVCVWGGILGLFIDWHYSPLERFGAKGAIWYKHEFYVGRFMVSDNFPIFCGCVCLCFLPWLGVWVGTGEDGDLGV